jgi:hypothetical protein
LLCSLHDQHWNAIDQRIDPAADGAGHSCLVETQSAHAGGAGQFANPGFESVKSFVIGVGLHRARPLVNRGVGLVGAVAFSAMREICELVLDALVRSSLSILIRHANAVEDGAVV